ncbi:MAG: RAMP superfamily CRISPR-associated protein [Leptolyngbyaceae bacterium]|nr:RAMP superfamily CRISPR-associated protein [Leptolyngbyaceae bacterium]
MNQRLQRRHQRSIQKRIIVRGVLELETPTCLSSGDAEADTDLPLLRDTVENKALLLGSSIAGALRSYLESCLSHAQLFGGTRRATDGIQSPLIVEDALSQQVLATELRDGVKIDGETGTASDTAKYDLELLQAGTRFDLGFELLVNQKTEVQLKEELAIALKGLEQGHIPIGMKKRRGFGQCSVKQWQVWEFDLTNDRERQAWLLFDHQWRSLHNDIPIHPSISEALGVNAPVHQFKTFTIKATFALASPLLIRSGQNDQDKAPDVVHLKSKRSNGNQPIISGTSLAGVLRHRAMRIINTINLHESIVQDIFGYEPEDAKKQSTKKQGKASRLTVQESVIEQTQDLVQTRIAIDRFTGGALHGALLQEQPIFGGEVTLKLELRNPKKHEIGLLLLLLKDLWTGDLPVGGSSSVGRGRLQGKEATITWQCSEPKCWKIEQEGDRQLKVTDLQNSSQAEKCVKQGLEGYVQALKTHFNGSGGQS